MNGGYEFWMRSFNIEQEGEIKANYLPITLGLKLQAGEGILKPYVYVGPGIFIPIAVGGEVEIETLTLPKRKAELTSKFTLGFGVASGFGLLLKLSDVFGIRFECAPTYAFARLKEDIVEYEDGTKNKTIYKKDAKDLPEDTAETMYVRGAPIYPFSSIAAKVGISLDF